MPKATVAPDQNPKLTLDEEVFRMNARTGVKIILDRDNAAEIDNLWEFLLHGIETIVRARAAKGETLEMSDYIRGRLDYRRRANPENNNESRL